MSETAPTIDGTEATFSDIDDIAWTEVQRQRNADGSVSVVREKWPIIRPDLLSAYVHYEPGMVVRRHGHRSNHVVIVLDGGAWIGGVWCTASTHIHVPLGAAFGPIVAGPDGVTCWELSFGEFGGWGDQLELYEREIAGRGITPLPDPPLDVGDWFHDPRGDVGAVRPSPKVEGMQEVITAVDGLAWTEVRRQRNRDGSLARVRVRWPILQPDFASAHVALDPGMIVRRHASLAAHLTLVVAGGAWIGSRWCPAGTHIERPIGAPLGPVVAGKRGATLLDLADGDHRGWGVEPERYEQAVAGHGATPLPDPPLDPGQGGEDRRSQWVPPEGPAGS